MTLLAVLSFYGEPRAEPPASKPTQESPDVKLSESPDKQWMVEFGEDQQLGLVYRVARLDGKDVILQIRSTYQPESQEDRKFELRNAEGATVSWSRDSRYLAIDEYNLRYQGAVHVAEIISLTSAVQIPVPLVKLKKRSGELWDRSRLGVGEEGWGEDGTLHLVLYGVAFKDKAPKSADRATKPQMGYAVKLQVTRSLAIRSVVPGDLAAKAAEGAKDQSKPE